MQSNVIQKAKKNILYGLLSKITILLCPFITRTAVQYILNSQYLGLSSLFNSILMVLNLAEFGFSSAVVYNMYKPVADGDIERVNALLLYFRKAYKIVGSVIGIVGLLIIPVLPKLISGTYPSDINLTSLYLIYLFNTVISYFMYSYLSAIIVVHQRDDINSSITLVMQLSLTAIQVVLLAYTKNFYAFVIIMPIFTIIHNIWIAWRVHHLFPQYSTSGELDITTREEIRKLVVGTFIHKLCTVTRFSIDNICISAFLGLTATAIYSNYYVIFNGISQMLFIISDSFIGGIGIHVATRSVDENYDELRKIDFSYLWVSGVCVICMLCFYQPFMELWMGRSMLMSDTSVLLLCIVFFACRLGEMRFMYYSANGLWWDNRWRATIETLLNIVLNIILGKKYGINGIILATLISFLSCNCIWSTRILFKKYFGLEKINDYYLYQIKFSGTVVVAGAICWLLSTKITITNLYYVIVVRAVMCFLVSNIVIYLVYRNTNEYEYLKKKLFTGKERLI